MKIATGISRKAQAWYNLPEQQRRMSSAMAAYLIDRLWDVGDVMKLIEEWGAQV